jgi:type IV pilus assembly protein PilP
LFEIPGTTGYYNPEGKLDPFSPLFREKPVAIAVKKVKRPTKPLTPLEKVDLSQLKLVGIVIAPSGNKALVKEASGKGYIVKKGTYIGIHSGKIVEIKQDRVIVEEEVEDIYGKISATKKTLQLQKPSGE